MTRFLACILLWASFVACQNRSNQVTQSKAQSEDVHWTVKVCSSRAASVTMQAGPSHDDNDVFATWGPHDGQKAWVMPQRVQSLNKIYFQATTPGKDQTDMCVIYSGSPKKNMSFDGGRESHDISANDDEHDCKCQ
jgi:hypothetical protein